MRSIFIFAHPDDEFGCYESIRCEVVSGNNVECYYLTDGGFGGQPVRPREAESIRVLQKLGVSRKAIHFIGRQYGIPDGFLPEHMAHAAEVLINNIGRDGDIAAIYVPAWEGGHQDHDATNIIACGVSLSLKARDGLWQYSLYHGDGLKWGLFNVMKPLESNGPTRIQVISLKHRFAYLRLCLSYPSQWRTWIGLFPFVAMKVLFVGRYYLQSASLRAAGRRPHAGPLLYERRKMARFREVEECVHKFVSQVPVAIELRL